MDNLTVYKGSKKPIKGDKECILVFDHVTRQCRLEKLASNISVKKTRYLYFVSCIFKLKEFFIGDRNCFIKVMLFFIKQISFRETNQEEEDIIKEKIQQMRLNKPKRVSNRSYDLFDELQDTSGKNRDIKLSNTDSSAKVMTNNQNQSSSVGRVDSAERNTSFSGILAEEAATSPSAHSSSSSSSTSSSSSSDDEDDVMDDSSSESNSDDDEHVEAIEKMMVIFML